MIYKTLTSICARPLSLTIIFQYFHYFRTAIEYDGIIFLTVLHSEWPKLHGAEFCPILVQ